MRNRWPAGFVVILALGFAACIRVDRAEAAESITDFPMYFEANRGQTDERVKYLSRGPGYTLFLTATEAVLKLAPSNPNSAASVLRLQLVGANPEPRVSGDAELPGKVNYFRGSDPAGWQRGAATYAKVRYERIYPGVDLVYYGNGQQLEYDFVVAPGANPEVIRLRFEGADQVEVDGQGDLLLHAGGGEVRMRRPLVYQDGEIAGRVAIDGGYELLSRTDGRVEVKFQLAAYDASKPLVIDPVLFYSTLVGGSGAEVTALAALAVDASGHAYVVGSTESADYPTGGALQATLAGNIDIVVTKFSPDGSGLIYSTYLGGSTSTAPTGPRSIARAIAVDAAENAYVTGNTNTSDFPVTLGALQTVYGESQDAFVLKISADGSTLVYATYLGGNLADDAYGVAVDSSGNAYVTGDTTTGFPTTPGALQEASSVGTNAFVSKINADASALVYSTYLGGDGFERAMEVEVDTSGNAYVTGITASTDFPTLNPIQTHQFGGDVFVTKLNPTGTALVYSTYLGGTEVFAAGDIGNDIAVDASGSAYVIGNTSSLDFPTTVGAFRTSNTGLTDAMVVKLNPAGSALEYSTYLGSGINDVGQGISVGADGSAYVIGRLNGLAGFPLVDPLLDVWTNPPGGCGGEAFLTRFDPSGSTVLFSTPIGGCSNENGLGVAVGPGGAVYASGTTGTGAVPEFSTTSGAFQTTPAGSGDYWVVKIDPQVVDFSTSSALNTDAATDGSRSDFRPYVATDGAGTWVAVWDSATDIWFARSTDDGSTWSAPVSIFSGTSAFGPRVATDGTTWVVAWHSSDTLVGSIGTDTDILTARSVDGGMVWSAAVALATTQPPIPGATNGRAWRPMAREPGSRRGPRTTT